MREFAIAGILKFLGIWNWGNFNNSANVKTFQLQGFGIEGILVMVKMWRLCNCRDFEICRDLQLREIWKLWELGEFAIARILRDFQLLEFWDLWEFAIARILRCAGICNSGNFENCRNGENLQLQGFSIEGILKIAWIWRICNCQNFEGFSIAGILNIVGIWRICNGRNLGNCGDLKNLHLWGFWELQHFELRSFWTLWGFREFPITGILNRGHFENCGNWRISNYRDLGIVRILRFAGIIEGMLWMMGIGRICNCRDFEICGDLQLRKFW